MKGIEKTYELLPGEKPVCHELPGSNCDSFFRHGLFSKVVVPSPPKNASNEAPRADNLPVLKKMNPRVYIITPFNLGHLRVFYRFHCAYSVNWPKMIAKSARAHRRPVFFLGNLHESPYTFT